MSAARGPGVGPWGRLPILVWLAFFLPGTLSGRTRMDEAMVSPAPLRLSGTGECAIIMHNGREEMLILGTRPGAVGQAKIPAFMPFPCERVVVPSSGALFEVIAKLMAEKKGIELVNQEFTKSGGARTVPFEFKEEPAAATVLYRFRTDRVYFPLKSLPATEGEGSVELALIAPGSLTGGATKVLFNITDYFHSPYLELPGPPRRVFELSNTAVVFPGELLKAYAEAEEFFAGVQRLFVQALRYSGPYGFAEDLSVEISRLDPRRYVWDSPEESSPWANEVLLRPAADDMVHFWLCSPSLVVGSDHLGLYAER